MEGNRWQLCLRLHFIIYFSLPWVLQFGPQGLRRELSRTCHPSSSVNIEKRQSRGVFCYLFPCAQKILPNMFWGEIEIYKLEYHKFQYRAWRWNWKTGAEGSILKHGGTEFMTHSEEPESVKTLNPLWLALKVYSKVCKCIIAVCTLRYGCAKLQVYVKHRHFFCTIYEIIWARNTSVLELNLFVAELYGSTSLPR